MRGPPFQETLQGQLERQAGHVLSVLSSIPMSRMGLRKDEEHMDSHVDIAVSAAVGVPSVAVCCPAYRDDTGSSLSL